MRGTIQVHDLPSVSSTCPGRRVRVWTPSGYSSTAAREFPVLYLQDGQNLFRDPQSETQGLRWQADATAQKLITSKAICPLILVGIDNSGANRADDYTPVDWKGQGGRAGDYADVLLSEIKPFIDRTYRTRSGPEFTALGGSSLGGLFSLYAGLRAPEVFGGIMAMSPSVFWGEEHILKEVEQCAVTDARIWLDVGRHETATMRKGLRKLHGVLTRKGWRRDRQTRLATLRTVEDPKGHHDELSWGRRFGRALRFLFPVKRPVGARARQPID